MNSIDKIKIFDYFSKKAKITSYNMFRRNRDSKLFGVNIISNRKEMCVEHSNHFVVDFKCKNDIDFYFYSFCAELFPDEFKEAIIDTCIELNEALIVTSYTNLYSMVFIPQASSLEELAIKMELES